MQTFKRYMNSGYLRSIFTAGIAVLSGVCLASSPRPDSNDAQTFQVVPIPRTEDFENGSRILNQTSIAELEVFLQDLLDRKEYDEACNKGLPGADGPYLVGWITKVNTELRQGGWCYGADGGFHYLSPAPEVKSPSTEQFESGRRSFAVTSNSELEAFFRDLSQRRDNDLDCHGGQAGPDGAFLSSWVQKATDELTRRGYRVDARGVLHPPFENADPNQIPTAK